ncbi:MAG: hypothetical protein ACRDQ7_27125 [Haloechinothrix sp.]
MQTSASTTTVPRPTQKGQPAAGIPRQDASRDRMILADACAAYQQMGWPAIIDERGTRVTVATGDTVDALIMPKTLGDVVAHSLIAAMQPVAILATGEGHWLC